MAKSVDAIKSLESRLIAKLQWASSDGSPVVGWTEEAWAETAALARRRWFSFDRRHKHKPDTHENRVEDLARALCDRFELGGFKLAGPVISDYRWLAEQLAEVLGATDDPLPSTR